MVPRTRTRQDATSSSSAEGNLDMDSFMRGMAGMLNQAQGGGGHGAAVPDQSLWLERFLKLHPPVFKGSPDPKVVEEWIPEVTKLFEVMQAPDE